MDKKRFALPIVRVPGYIQSTIIGATLPHFVANISLTYKSAAAYTFYVKSNILSKNDSRVEAAELYASPRTVTGIDQCYFYHSMDLPRSGPVEGPFDLRPGIDSYLGGVSFVGKRVLEIGPASGYVTFHMEQSGADVVAVETSEEFGWDYVPQVEALTPVVLQERAVIMDRLRNGFWLAHAEFGSSARIHYGSAYQLPAEMGQFDVAVMACVLLHCRDPLRVIENCARRAPSLVIVDRSCPDLPDGPVCRLVPTRENGMWDTWWDLSPLLLRQFLAVMGFTNVTTTFHVQRYSNGMVPLFTIVAGR